MDEDCADAQALSMEELAVLGEERERLLTLWPQLREDDRWLLEGRYLLGLSDETLARQMGCRPDSVRMKLTRARRRAFALIAGKEARQ